MKLYNALPKDFRIGERYLIRRTIGHGTSSTVYEALDLPTKSTVALKILDPFLAQEPVSLARFEREVKILATLDHPNIIKVYSFFRHEDFHVIAMEHFPAQNAAEAIGCSGPLPVPIFVEIAKSVVSCLIACHHQGILHRDIKPTNLLISPQTQQIKLVDFGISKINTMSDLTKTGTIIGTPEYMAPECYSSNLADPRSDIYSTGALFYELLTGRPPFTGKNLAQLVQQQLGEGFEKIEVIKGNVPPWLTAIVEKCLHVSPQNRYQCCEDLLSDLDRGMGAMVILEKDRRLAQCLHCQATSIPGLPFCAECGLYASSELTRGNTHLVIDRCDSISQVYEVISKVDPRLDAPTFERRIKKLPRVLLSSLSEDSALRVATNLATTPCRTLVSESLPLELQLPKSYHRAVFAALAVCVVGIYGDWVPLGVIPLVAATVGCEAALLILFYRRTRPVLRLGTGGAQEKVQADPLINDAIPFFKACRDSNLKRVLGHIVALSAQIAKQCKTAIGYGGLGHVVTKATAVALERAKRCEVALQHLKQTNPIFLKQKLGAIEMQLRVSENIDETERLIRLKGEIDEELRQVHEIEDRHSHDYISFFRLLGMLKEILLWSSSQAATDEREGFGHYEQRLEELLIPGPGGEEAELDGPTWNDANPIPDKGAASETASGGMRST